MLFKIQAEASKPRPLLDATLYRSIGPTRNTTTRKFPGPGPSTALLPTAVGPKLHGGAHRASSDARCVLFAHIACRVAVFCRLGTASENCGSGRDVQSISLLILPVTQWLLGLSSILWSWRRNDSCLLPGLTIETSERTYTFPKKDRGPSNTPQINGIHTSLVSP